MWPFTQPNRRQRPLVLGGSSPSKVLPFQPPRGGTSVRAARPAPANVPSPISPPAPTTYDAGPSIIDTVVETSIVSSLFDTSPSVDPGPSIDFTGGGGDFGGGGSSGDW